MNSRTSLVTKVSRWRSGTQKTRIHPVPCSTIPNTHWLSETCPRLYFRLLPNIDLSISTVFPRHPAWSYRLRSSWSRYCGFSLGQSRWFDVIIRLAERVFCQICQWTTDRWCTTIVRVESSSLQRKIQPWLIYAFCSYLLDIPRQTHCGVILGILNKEQSSMANAFQLAQFPRSTICDFVATVEWKIVDAREHKYVIDETFK